MRNEPSLSSASATKSGPPPSAAPDPVAARMPPMTYPGSAPVSRSTVVIIDVVVVLPCVPVTAMTRRPNISEASAPARCSTRMPRRLASASSGFPARIALDTTSVSASPRWPALWPTCTRAPSESSTASTGEAAESVPETLIPRVSMIRAIPDIPAPPMPAKCTRPRSSSGTASVGVTRPIGCSSSLGEPLTDVVYGSPNVPVAAGGLRVLAAGRRTLVSGRGDGAVRAWRPRRLAGLAVAGVRSGSGPVWRLGGGDVDDRLRQPAVGVLAAERGRGLRHGGHLVDVGQHRQQRSLDPVRCELVVLDEQAAAALHDRERVKPLLAVADGQRDIPGGQADGGQLGAGHSARAAQGEVGGGVSQLHPVDVGDRHVRDRP